MSTIDLTKFATVDPTCDHCGLARDRKSTYVLYNEAEDKLVRVGRSCLCDYTGANDPERLLSFLEEVSEFCGEIGARGAVVRPTTTTFLTHVATCIRAYGFESAKSFNPTGQTALTNFYNRLDERKDKKTGEPLWVEPTEADEAAAIAVRQWVAENEEVSDYILNLRAAVLPEFLPERANNLAASAFAARDRDIVKRAEMAAKAAKLAAQGEKEFIGEVGDKVTFEATLIRTIRIVDRYSYDDSTKPLYVFQTPEGNEVKWFSSRDIGDLEQEGVYSIKGTVKKLDDHEQYGKSTVVTRCKVVEVISNPAAEDREETNRIRREKGWEELS